MIIYSRYRLLILTFTLLFTAGVNADIIYESGSLREFIGGNSPSTAYDNFVSHISEGIAAPGYNNYAPDWIDVQTDGFGNYRVIPQFSYTLVHWRNIFQALLENDLAGADQLLTDSLATFHYELIHFEDTDYNRTYYMVREKLNMSYMDPNHPDIIGDEVVGSFANGWGIFIINPAAARQQVLVEVPHPCDDFIAPYLGVDMFLQTDAFGLTIAGAGREVVWSGAPYTNNSSRSDPARNANSVFQVFHEVLCDSLMQIGPHSPLVLHTHSFDDNSAHSNFQSIVLSGGWDAANANKPIRDISDDNFDLVNFTAEYPVDAGQFGEHDAERVDAYYRVHYSGSFRYHGADQDYDVPHTYTLLGPNTGAQMNYLRGFFNNNEVYEPWVQIEFYEKPMLFQNMDMPLTELYAGSYPSSYANYSILLEYYQPFIDALEAYLENWDIPDVTPPPAIPNWRVEFDGQNYVSLRWDPVFDTNHRTYRLFYDTDSLRDDSPVIDASSNISFANPRTNSFMMTNLDPDERYVFRLDAQDHFFNLSPPGEILNQTLPGHEPLVVLENFNNGNVELGSYLDEDVDPTLWGLSESRTFMNTQHSLSLWGNTWKTQTIPPHSIDPASVFQIAAYIETRGEIQGVAFQDSLNTLYYALDGSEQLDINAWETVYQGYFPEQTWNIYRLPVGADWLARFEYNPRLTTIIYINDRDTDPLGKVYFDELFDISNSIAFAPRVEITHSQGVQYRNSSRQRSVDVSFNTIITDADSDNHTFQWNFGDGETSTEAAPMHTFLIEDDHAYTVLLLVMDESGNLGQARTEITVDQGPNSFPLTLNFVGDIMIARRYEDAGGILETGGVSAIFEPTLELLGNAADLSIANLECSMTLSDDEHPTKSVVYKGRPEYVAGIAEAGIDLVSLANNHTLDYGATGLVETQASLIQNNILFSGSGLDSDEAYRPIFTNTKGVSIAYLANCDRTGQYNNSQPYLNAGYNKPGFAYLTPYYLSQQINTVRAAADLVVMEMHAGSEYSSSPGAEYDGAQFGDGIPVEDWIAPRELNANMDQAEFSDEDENYSPLLDVPHMWDREIRHFAIDSGADLVVIHHPHIIQGFEVYHSKLIAHSLGNYVFDLNYHETFPSVILNAEVDASGFAAYSVTPIYIDDYIPVPATGALGNHLLDYLADKSRELDTYLYVDRENSSASIWLDTLSMPRTHIQNRRAFRQHLVGSTWMSDPQDIHEFGNLSALSSPTGSAWSYRLGRELLWYGNMENEGSSGWNINSDDEWIDLTEAHTGAQSIGQHRTPSSGDNVITNLENRIRVDASKTHHISASLKTLNANNVTVQVRYYSDRTSTAILATHTLTTGFDGTNDWTTFNKESIPPSNATYFDVRLNTDMPDAGDGYGWFDDVHIIEWTDWASAPEAEITSPNDFYFLQLSSGTLAQNLSIEYVETVYNDPEPVSVDFHSSATIALVETEIQFTDASTGPVGWWEWDFGDGEQSIEQNPVHIYSQTGFYDVSLSVLDHLGSPHTETKSNHVRIFSQYLPGDLNFDGQNSISDIVVLVHIIIGDINPSPPQYETGDVNGDSNINVQDLISLINVILYN